MAIKDKFLSFLYGKKGSVSNSDLPKETKLIITNLINDIANHYEQTNPKYRASVSIKGWRGKSGLKVVKYPKIFKLTEYRKKDPNSEPKEQNTIIELETFNKVVKILALVPLDKPIKTKEFSEMFCNEYGMLDFFDGGEFVYSKLFGTRKVYLHEIYYPLKISEHYGIIKYNKSGFITRLSDNFEIPVEISEEVYNG